jgi:deoxyribodipyrimidine photo-lyase
MYKRSIFIFRRDLRLEDNTALLAAAKQSEEVLLCFIFDPRQKNHSYFSSPGFQFLCESLEDLRASCKKSNSKLYIFSGLPEDVLSFIHKKMPFNAVFTNADYTPFSKTRDTALQTWCNKQDIQWHQYDDLLLQPGILKDDKTPYTVFTPYYRKASQIEVQKPREIPDCNWYMGALPESEIPSYEELPELYVHGGRAKALEIMARISQLRDYQSIRDTPALQTSGLSAHNKFGTISIREVYYGIRKTLGAFHPLLRQLYWRDFFYTIAINFPSVFGNAFQKQFDAVIWDSDKRKFSLWCEGKTGFPIVDAGMRQLNATGYMHNRVRMIVASFLTKDLHIDWRWGEKYFAQKLVDYDPCVNNGSWQWAASTGCDAQPYFRIFNPWLQQKKFDSECQYIKKWVPELREISVANIHAEIGGRGNYPEPVVIHAQEKDIALQRFAITKSNKTDA